VQVNLTATYNPGPDSSSTADTSSFIGHNSSTQASLYWGESMLLMYWLQLTDVLFLQNGDEPYQYFKGYSSFTRTNTTLPTDAASVESLDFFSQVDCFFFAIQLNWYGPCCGLVLGEQCFCPC
jgi:hypothetical protein